MPNEKLLASVVVFYCNMVDREKLQALIEWMFQSVGNDLMAVVIVDRDGLVMASLLRRDWTKPSWEEWPAWLSRF